MNKMCKILWKAAPALLVSVALSDEGRGEKYVSLAEAHYGTLHADLRILNQFHEQPAEVQEFYIHARDVLFRNSSPRLMKQVCDRYGRKTLGGPMLGDLGATGVTVRVQFPDKEAMTVKVWPQGAAAEAQSYETSKANRIHHVRCDGLKPLTAYQYEVRISGQE